MRTMNDQNYYKCLSSFSRPIVVTFEEFKDRDEVLRKAGLVKGGQVHVTEDMSRKVSHHHHHYQYHHDDQYVRSGRGTLRILVYLERHRLIARVRVIG